MGKCRVCEIALEKVLYKRQGWICHDCYRKRAVAYNLKWRKANPKKWSNYARQWRSRNTDIYRKRLDRGKAFLRSSKEKPCADCNQSFPYYVMDFDHIPERGKKKILLSNGSKHSLKTLATEIAKCDVVCANCHRKRTHTRALQSCHNRGSAGS